MAFDCVCRIDDRFQPAVRGPEIPLLEEASGGLVRVVLLVEVLEGEAYLIGPCGLEMTRGQTVSVARCRSDRLAGLRSQIYTPLTR